MPEFVRVTDEFVATVNLLSAMLPDNSIVAFLTKAKTGDTIVLGEVH